MQMFFYSLLIIYEKALVALELQINKEPPSNLSTYLGTIGFFLSLFSLLVSTIC